MVSHIITSNVSIASDPFEKLALWSFTRTAFDGSSKIYINAIDLVSLKTLGAVKLIRNVPFSRYQHDGTTGPMSITERYYIDLAIDINECSTVHAVELC